MFKLGSWWVLSDWHGFLEPFSCLSFPSSPFWSPLWELKSALLKKASNELMLQPYRQTAYTLLPSKKKKKKWDNCLSEHRLSIKKFTYVQRMWPDLQGGDNGEILVWFTPRKECERSVTWGSVMSRQLCSRCCGPRDSPRQSLNKGFSHPIWLSQLVVIKLNSIWDSPVVFVIYLGGTPEILIV